MNDEVGKNRVGPQQEFGLARCTKLGNIRVTFANVKCRVSLQESSLSFLFVGMRTKLATLWLGFEQIGGRFTPTTHARNEGRDSGERAIRRCEILWYRSEINVGVDDVSEQIIAELA